MFQARSQFTDLSRGWHGLGVTVLHHFGSPVLLFKELNFLDLSISYTQIQMAHTQTSSKGFVWSQLWSSEPGRGCRIEGLNLFPLLPSLAPCGYLRGKRIKNHFTQACFRSKICQHPAPLPPKGWKRAPRNQVVKACILGMSLCKWAVTLVYSFGQSFDLFTALGK